MDPRSPAAAALVLCACAPTVAPECPTDVTVQEERPPAAVEEPCDTCCAVLDRGGPEIVDAGWDPGKGVLTLTFSRPVRVAKQVSPSQFRLSYASASDDGTQAEVQYYDPLYYFAGGDDDSDGNPELLHFVELEQLDELRIALEASRTIDDVECPQPLEPAGNDIEGIFLHYTNARRGVEDAAGNRMKGFGAAWAKQTSSVHAEANGTAPVHRIDLLIPVHCTEAEG